MPTDDWLPEDLQQRLDRYRNEQRLADPTDGFMLTCCLHHPDFDERAWRGKTPTMRRTYMKKLLGLPKENVVRKKSTGDR